MVDLGKAGRSAQMIKKIVRSLGSIFKEARRRGLSNVAPTLGLDLDLPERDDPRPVIPIKAELQAIIAGATAHKSRLWRTLVLVAVFCGLRASELRGLRWADVDFDARLVCVSQRADALDASGA
jgi:integrase